ncbi:hypothetical protein ACFQZ4_15475 [Catellatospora coxensis]
MPHGAPLRRALLSAAAIACVLLPATPARAAGDLAVTVRGDDPLATVLVLANRGDAACQVVTSAYGTLAVTRLEQDGVTVTPLPMETSFAESLEAVLAERLHTLEPGRARRCRCAPSRSGRRGTPSRSSPGRPARARSARCTR